MNMIPISPRLIFGGTTVPSEFEVTSDIATDTINDLILCNTWNQKIHSPSLQVRFHQQRNYQKIYDSQKQEK